MTVSKADTFFSYTSSQSDKYQCDKRHESHQNVITGVEDLVNMAGETRKLSLTLGERVEETFIYSFINQLRIVLLIRETQQLVEQMHR